MPFPQKDREQLLQKHFNLDFPTMALAPKSSRSRGRTFNGAGSVSVIDGGRFQIKLYHAQPISIDELFRSMEWRSGEIISEECYYELKAKDVEGKEWAAEGLLPDSSSGPGGTVVTANAAKLILREKISPSRESQTHYLRITYGKAIKFPANTVVKTEKHVGHEARISSHHMSAAKFKVCDIQFEIEEDGGATVVSAQSDALRFDDKAISCIIDAFSFVTGSIEPWAVLEIWQDDHIETRLQTSPIDTKSSRIDRPVGDGRLSQAEACWRLFEKYLAYGLKSNDANGHPLGGLVRTVIAAGKGAVEVEALTLAVSTESLLADHFPAPKANDEVLKRNIKVTADLVNAAQNLDSGFRIRLLGTLNAMQFPRAKDVLTQLQKDGLIDSTLVKVYGELRNKSAHGVKVDWAEIQPFLNQCGSVLVLFYQLIFLKISYIGPYTDYGTYDYPLKTFTSILKPQDK